MSKPRRSRSASPSASCSAVVAGLAKQYNTQRPYLPPSGQVKINNARAKMFVVQHEIEKKARRPTNAGQNGCPDGVFVDRSNPRREVIIATKDIVNLGGQLDLNASCR